MKLVGNIWYPGKNSADQRKGARKAVLTHTHAKPCALFKESDLKCFPSPASVSSAPVDRSEKTSKRSSPSPRKQIAQVPQCFLSPARRRQWPQIRPEPTAASIL